MLKLEMLQDAKVELVTLMGLGQQEMHIEPTFCSRGISWDLGRGWQDRSKETIENKERNKVTYSLKRTEDTQEAREERLAGQTQEFGSHLFTTRAKRFCSGSCCDPKNVRDSQTVG